MPGLGLGDYTQNHSLLSTSALSHVIRGGTRSASASSQVPVEVFERREQARERVLQMSRMASRPPEIASTKLVRGCDYGGSQRPVFVRTLCPREPR